MSIHCMSVLNATCDDSSALQVFILSNEPLGQAARASQWVYPVNVNDRWPSK